MKRITFIFVAIVIFLSFNLESTDSVIFKLTNMVCKSYNESWFKIHKCRLKALRRDVTAFYFNGSVLHPVKNIKVQAQLFKKANGYKPWLIKTSVDVCRYQRKPYNEVVKLVVNLFLEYTNFNHTCPFMGTQIVDGFYLRPELLKLPFPTGEYKLAIGWHFDKKLQFETNASFEYTENLIDQ